VVGAVAFYRHNTHVYEVPAGRDVFAMVEGTWAWTTTDRNCATDPHRITFTSDHKGMLITSAHRYRRPDGRLDSVAYYDIEGTPAVDSGSHSRRDAAHGRRPTGCVGFG
jgi:hypothetical protein